MKLPDAEALLEKILAEVKPLVTPDLAIVGLHTGGAWVAERLHQALGLKLPLGTLDVSFYRDDFSRSGFHGEVAPTQIPFVVEGARILLVDDVLYTGRTIRAAMNELFDYGRPDSILLAVLVDRGGRELPIGAQFVGERMALPQDEQLWLEKDGAKLKFTLHRKG
jgi:pyrimidine operon attenuation protein/uracil phosphoribosyltransferase